MPITVKYFGAIAEATGVSEEVMALEDIDGSLKNLKSVCLAKYVSIGDLSFQLAINQTLTASDTLKDGDEVAFLPPFAGG